MPNCFKFCLFGLALFVMSSFDIEDEDVWGFYAHKLINQHAIYLLPVDLIPVFKSHLDDVRHFAIAPDQRRHSSPFEAARHYIDIDHWGTYPFDNLPRKYDEAVWKMAEIYFHNSSEDSIDVKIIADMELRDSLMEFYRREMRYDDKKRADFNIEVLNDYVPKGSSVLRDYTKFTFVNHLDEYGILPYHLVEYQNRLKNAFVRQDLKKIIRLAGELGHYIGDAHVPLHTTVNYNGQLTGQDGIHAFWETRIPELFATAEYDFWVEPREYIEDKEAFFWNIVLDSHQLVGDVLGIEADLRVTFPKDEQFCFGERLGKTSRIECEAYAQEYQRRMNGMVEQRMRAAITAIASAWYTAWVDAGSPLLTDEKIIFEKMVLDTLALDYKIRTRVENE